MPLSVNPAVLAPASSAGQALSAWTFEANRIRLARAISQGPTLLLWNAVLIGMSPRISCLLIILASRKQGGGR